MAALPSCWPAPSPTRSPAHPSLRRRSAPASAKSTFFDAWLGPKPAHGKEASSPLELRHNFHMRGMAELIDRGHPRQPITAASRAKVAGLHDTATIAGTPLSASVRA